MAGIVGSKSARASGGISTTTVGPYTVHAFTTTGANTFTPATTGFVDVLLIGGGGGAGGFPSTFGSSGGGGAGATLLKKMIPVTASTPYPFSVGAGGPTAAGSSRGTTGSSTTAFGNSAAGGGGGGVWNNSPSVPLDGESVPLASGGGSVGPGPVGIPAGANIYGVGYPGGRNSGSGSSGGGGGGGAGGAGQAGTSESGTGAGGPGIPIVYFTNNPADINISKGGAGYPTPATPTAGGGGYGSGGYVTGSPPNPSGRPGAIYVRYI
jgi:hypothetical protein